MSKRMEAIVLAILSRYQKGLSAKQVADISHHSCSSIRKALSSLHKQGLVRKDNGKKVTIWSL